MLLGNRKKLRQILICHMAFSLLAGCSYGSYLPTGDKQARMAGQESRKMAVTPVSRAMSKTAYANLSWNYVTVQNGDSLSILARRMEIPMAALAALNTLEAPYPLYIGQQLKVPAFRRHRIVGGENLYAISRAYNVDMTELVHFNRLSAPYSLVIGDQLRIPLKGGQVASGTGSGSSVDRAGVQMASLGGKGLMPLKQSGPVSASLPRPNSAPAPTSLPLERAMPVVNEQPKPALPAKTAKLTPPQAAKVPASGQSLIPTPRKRLYDTDEPPRRSKGPFIWPAKGPLVSGYGVKKSGFRNDGVNIRLKAGTPVRAAENGVVSYVGNEMRSFGNLLLISHSGGYVTAYGHTEKLLVQKGERVRKGDIVAYAGASGNVSSPQLHFEIRKKGKAVNPLTLLASR